jgi:mRNA-degrading endonuclease RelE of RelBE toxin-antitoxin system
MKYEIEILPEFAKRLKRLVKKFRTLPNEAGLLSHASTRVFIVNNNIFYYIKIT